jgi:prepilin-type N-terminal cleavage/methylation domain-containing protein
MRAQERRRAGFTMPEVLIAMMILLVITGAATQFMRRQTNLVTREAARADALQNAQFSASQIERELREAGAGVLDVQPMIVQLDAMAITFNANMVSIDTGDVKAVYQLRDADTAGTRVMWASERLALPNSYPAVNYPDTTYNFKSTPSFAETISYYLRPDSTTSLANRYLLFRRANALAPTLVARGIVKDSRDSTPFFTYYKKDTLNRLNAIPSTTLPLYHGTIHGAPNDTGRAALTDSVYAVRIHFVTATPDPRGGKDKLRTVETTVRLMNAGLFNRTTCGQPPYSTPSVTATSSAAGAVTASVTLVWGKSVDDGTGEKDIERYAIFRRVATATQFGEPITSVPAGGLPTGVNTYSFVDTSVLQGQTYVYGIAAQDCSPLLSAVTTASSVTVQ